MKKEGNKAKTANATKTGETKSPTNQTYKLKELWRLFVSFEFIIIPRDVIPSIFAFAAALEPLLLLKQLYFLSKDTQVAVHDITWSSCQRKQMRYSKLAEFYL